MERKGHNYQNALTGSWGCFFTISNLQYEAYSNDKPQYGRSVKYDSKIGNGNRTLTKLIPASIEITSVANEAQSAFWKLFPLRPHASQDKVNSISRQARIFCAFTSRSLWVTSDGRVGSGWKKPSEGFELPRDLVGRSNTQCHKGTGPESIRDS